MQPAKVLLLESVAAQAAAARNALVGAGYRLVISRFESDGLLKIKDWKPDIVVLSNAYTKSSLTAFCRRLLSEGDGFRIVIASSLPLKRLLSDEPELRPLVSAFVLRPYNPQKLREAVDKLVLAPPAVDRPPDGANLRGKRVFLAESDVTTAAAVRHYLSPLGIAVDIYNRNAADRGAKGSPQAVIVGWPAPKGFNFEVLRELGAGGPLPPLIVITAEHQDAVKERAPALFNRTRMIFTKPVPWDHFTRYLAHMLVSPSPPATAQGAPEKEDPALLKQQVAVQAREIAELKKRLFESGGRDNLADIDTAALVEKEKELTGKLAELEKQIEVERAKHQFKETELEVKLSSLLRKRSESEKRAQDLIDEGNERAEDMQRALAEAHGEIHLQAEEIGMLKKDLEEVLIAKEHAEEELQAQRLSLEKGQQALDEEKSRVGGQEEELRKKLEAAQEELDTYGATEASLRRELEGHGETLAARDQEVAGLRDQVTDMEAEKENLRRDVASLEERLAAAAASSEEAVDTGLAEEADQLRVSLEQSEETVKGLDGELALWREKAAAAEAALAEAAAREAVTAEESEKRGHELEELREGMADLQAEAEELRAAASGVRDAKHAEEELEVLKSTLADRESSMDDMREALGRAEASERELRERAEKLEEDLQGREEGFAELSRAVGDEKKRRARAEEQLARVQEQAEERAGQLDEDLRRTLEEAERQLDDLREEVEGLSAAVASREAERDEARQSLEAELKRRGELEEELAAATEAAAEAGSREGGELEETKRLLAEAEERAAAVEALEEEAAGLRTRGDELQRRLEKESFDAGEHKRELERRLEVSEEEQGALRQRIEDLIAEAATESEGLREAQARIAELDKDADESRTRTEELSRQLHEAKAALSREEEESRVLRERVGEKSESLQKAREDLEPLREKVREQAEELQSGFVALEAARSATAKLEGELEELRRELNDARGELEGYRTDDRREEIDDLRRHAASLEEEVEEARKESRDAERIQKMLEEVTARAQAEIIEQSRKEVELQERLRTSVEEKKFLIARMEKELAAAAERERRLSDLLEKALKGTAQLSASLGRTGEIDNLPVALAPAARRSAKTLPALGAAAAALVIAGVVALALYGLRGVERPAPAQPEQTPVAEKPAPPPDKGLSAQKEIWKDWSRSDVSGGVLFQATLRSPEEITASVEAEKRVRGWSEERAAAELKSLLDPYRFDKNIYFHIYLKNLEPGYPSYVDDIYANLYLRDSSGKEARAFLPADLEKHRRVYSFSSGELAKGRKELIYEVGVPVAFARADLSDNPSFIELLAYNVGASSRRVLTWELR